MTLSNKTRGLMVAAACAAVGAGGGIVGSMASPSKHHKTSKKSAATGKSASRAPARRGFDRGPGGGHGMGGRPVHAEAVVLNQAGTKFITVTEDSGKVKSVSGSDVTITEGTDTVTYKDVTVTIPDDATIVRNGAKAAVGDLEEGDFVHVEQSSDGTNVSAADPTWQPAGDMDGDGDRRGMMPPPGAPAGPPPAPPSGY